MLLKNASFVKSGIEKCQLATVFGRQKTCIYLRSTVLPHQTAVMLNSLPF